MEGAAVRIGRGQLGPKGPKLENMMAPDFELRPVEGIMRECRREGS